MYTTHIAFAVAAIVAAGNCQAQTWQQFIDNGAIYTTRVAPGHGLSVDGAGGIFVQTMDTHPVSGTDFSHLYALAADGSPAYPWSLVARPGGGPDAAFVSRAFRSNAGHRVAWYEVGANDPYDLIVLFSPHNPLPAQQLTLSRPGGIKVLGAASDGQGGLLLLRSGNSSTLPTLLRISYAFGSAQLLWEQTVADCNPGTVTVDPQDVDFAFDTQNPSASAIHVLGRCNSGIAGVGNSFVQSFNLDGSLLQQRRFLPQQPNLPLLARHRIGDGAWLYEYGMETGGDGRLLQVADAAHGLYPLPWPDIQGDVAVDSLGRTALVRAASASSPAHYRVAGLQRSPGGLFEASNTQLYKGLSANAAYGMRWSADSEGYRVVAYRSAAPGVAGTLTVAGFAGESEPQWQRSIDAIDSEALPQLRLEPATNEFVLAVDRTQNGSHGIWLEQFPATASCLPPFNCLPGSPPAPRK